MPIRPENKHRYPDNWDEITAQLKGEVGYQCEGSPAYPDCHAEQYQSHPITGAKVVLTVGHLNHRPEDIRRENLRVWCQKCHNTHDAPYRAQRRAQRKHEKGEV